MSLSSRQRGSSPRKRDRAKEPQTAHIPVYEDYDELTSQTSATQAASISHAPQISSTLPSGRMSGSKQSQMSQSKAQTKSLTETSTGRKGLGIQPRDGVSRMASGQETISSSRGARSAVSLAPLKASDDHRSSSPTRAGSRKRGDASSSATTVIPASQLKPLPSLYALTRRTKAVNKKHQRGRSASSKRAAVVVSEASSSESGEATLAHISSGRKAPKGILRKTSTSLSERKSAPRATFEGGQKPAKKKGVRWKGDTTSEDESQDGASSDAGTLDEVMHFTREAHELSSDDETDHDKKGAGLHHQQRLRAALAVAAEARRTFMASNERAPHGLSLGRPAVRAEQSELAQLSAGQGIQDKRRLAAKQKRLKKEQKKRMRQLMKKRKKRARADQGSSTSESDSDTAGNIELLGDTFESDSETDSTTTETETPTDSELSTETELESESEAESLARIHSQKERSFSRTSDGSFESDLYSLMADLPPDRPGLRNIQEEEELPSARRSERLSITHTNSEFQGARRKLFGDLGSDSDSSSHEDKASVVTSILSPDSTRKLGLPQRRSERRVPTPAKPGKPQPDLSSEDEGDSSEKWREARRQSLRARHMAASESFGSLRDQSMTTPSRPAAKRTSTDQQLTPATETASLLQQLRIPSDATPSARRSPRTASKKVPTVMGPITPGKSLDSRNATKPPSPTLMETLRTRAGLRPRGQRSRASILTAPVSPTPEAKAEKEAGVNKHLLGLAGEFGLDTSYLKSLQDSGLSDEEEVASVQGDPEYRFKSLLSSGSDEPSDVSSDPSDTLYEAMAASGTNTRTQRQTRSRRTRAIQQPISTGVTEISEARLGSTPEHVAETNDQVTRTKQPRQKRAMGSRRRTQSRRSPSPIMPDPNAPLILSDGLLIDDYQRYYDKIDDMDLNDIFLVE